MRTLSILFVFACTISGFAQIGAKVQQNKIQGTWHNNTNDYQMTLILNADGSGEFDGESIHYSTKDGKFMMKVEGESQTLVYNYTLNGSSLTISGGDLDEPYTFTRAGTSTEQSVAPVVAQSTNANVSVDKSLIGLWSGNNETIEFTADGKCNYLGQIYPYVVSSGHLTLQTDQGNFMMDYSIKGNELSLDVNGKTVQYTKGTSNAKNNSPTTGGAKRVAQELVGRWCYVNVNSTNSGGSSTEQCLTLRADGTYEYYGESSRSVNTNAYAGGTNSVNVDRGTWTYDGTRIYYNSAAGEGSGSYVLEKRNHPKNNDPMIVLDGTTYVTYYQKAPWK